MLKKKGTNFEHYIIHKPSKKKDMVNTHYINFNVLTRSLNNYINFNTLTGSGKNLSHQKESNTSSVKMKGAPHENKISLDGIIN